VVCSLSRSRLPRSSRSLRSLEVVALAFALSSGLTLGAPGRASAQEPESRPPSPATPPPSTPSPSTPEGTASEPDETLARARAVVAVAEPLFLAGHYEAALAEYSRAYQILEGHPRQYWVLHNLAACNERLFRYDVAVELYEHYLRRAPASEEDRKEVSAILATLRSLLATLVIESSVAGEVWLDDRRLGAAPGKWRVPAGRHIVELRADRYESQRREVQLSAGQLEIDRFQLRRLSTYAGPPPVYFWVAVGLTGAATVAGATAGFMALNAREQGREQAALYLDTQADAERTRHLALASDIGFGAAALFGATATVLYFVTDWEHSGARARQPHEPRAQRSLGVTLAAPGGFGATVRGQF
jgi:PEGA domain-containing protein